MKYVHVFSGLESADVDEGSLHWPWVAPDRVELHDRVARARTAAREEVAARVGSSPTLKAPKGAARSRKAAAAALKRSRARAARAADRATSTSSPATPGEGEADAAGS